MLLEVIYKSFNKKILQKYMGEYPPLPTTCRPKQSPPRVCGVGGHCLDVFLLLVS